MIEWLHAGGESVVGLQYIPSEGPFNEALMAALRRGHPLQVGLVDGLIPCARCEIGNGAILNMRRAEIDRQFDSIVDFSGLADSLETPVKRMSSGMKARCSCIRSPRFGAGRPGVEPCA